MSLIANDFMFAPRRCEQAFMASPHLAGNSSTNKRTSNWSFANESCSCTERSSMGEWDLCLRALQSGPRHVTAPWVPRTLLKLFGRYSPVSNILLSMAKSKV